MEWLNTAAIVVGLMAAGGVLVLVALVCCEGWLEGPFVEIPEGDIPPPRETNLSGMR